MSENTIQKNLIFEGGGMMLITYLGALEVIEERGILHQIERVAGASAGAITSFLVSLNLSAAEIKENIDSLNFSKIPQKLDTEEHKKTSLWSIPNEMQNLIGGDLAATHRLFTKFGWYSSSYFYDWLQETVAKYSTSSRKGLSTFADFREQGFRDLHVVATNLSTQTSNVAYTRCSRG